MKVDGAPLATTVVGLSATKLVDDASKPMISLHPLILLGDASGTDTLLTFIHATKWLSKQASRGAS